MDHPRSGLIQNLVAIPDIKAGEELLHDYGYKFSPLEFPFVFPSYWNLKRKVESRRGFR